MTTVRCWHLERRHMLRFWLKHVASVLLSLKAHVCVCSHLFSLCFPPKHYRYKRWRFSLIWRSPYGRSVGNEGPQIIENIMRDFDTQRKVAVLRRNPGVLNELVGLHLLPGNYIGYCFLKVLLKIKHINSPMFSVGNVYLHTHPTNSGPAELQ